MKRWIHANTRGSNLLGNIVTKVEWEIRDGLDPHDAIIKVCDELGYAHDDKSDNVYNYLLSRFDVDPVVASTDDEEDDEWAPIEEEEDFLYKDTDSESFYYDDYKVAFTVIETQSMDPAWYVFDPKQSEEIPIEGPFISSTQAMDYINDNLSW